MRSITLMDDEGKEAQQIKKGLKVCVCVCVCVCVYLCIDVQCTGFRPAVLPCNESLRDRLIRSHSDADIASILTHAGECLQPLLRSSRAAAL